MSRFKYPIPAPVHTGVILAVVAAVLYMCRDAQGPTQHAAWNASSVGLIVAALLDVVNEATDNTIEKAKEMAAWVNDLLDTTGLKPLVGPIFRALGDALGGLQDFLRRTGAAGYLALLLLATYVVLSISKRG